MKNLISILAVFALFATSTFAQDTPTKTKAPVATKAPTALTDSEVKKTQVDGGPEMTFEVTEVDYGTIKQGSDPLRVFKFSNTGDEPLIISKAKGSCGCTVPKYPQEAILPGEAAEIEVRYDTNRIGPFQKTVTLTTNEGSPTHTLKIKGKVEPKPAEDSVPASQGGFGNN